MNAWELKSKLIRSLVKRLLNNSLIRSELIKLSTSKIFCHAIATPLSVLNLSISLLRETKLSKKQNLYLDRINSAIEYIGDLVSQISFVDEPTKKNRFDLDQAVSQIIALLEDNYSIITQISSYQNKERCYLLGPKILFQEAVSCILSNAIQAYPNSNLPKPIMVATHLQDQWVRLDIIDLGQGMNKQQLKNAYLPGLSSKDTNRGWGLPFAKQVVELQFKGKFEIVSFANRGTRVTMLFPREEM